MDTNSQTDPAETKSCCIETPGIDLNEFFATRSKAGLMNQVHRRAVDFLLESKAIEYMSGLQLLMGAPKDTVGHLADQVAHHLVFIVSALSMNLDMEKIKASIQPCGEPDCKCHETKGTVVQGLIMLRDYLREIEKRGDATILKMGSH